MKGIREIKEKSWRHRKKGELGAITTERLDHYKGPCSPEDQGGKYVYSNKFAEKKERKRPRSTSTLHLQTGKFHGLPEVKQFTGGESYHEEITRFKKRFYRRTS